MKSYLIAVLLCTLFLSVCSSTFAQGADQQEMMKKWQEYMTPGPVHQGFAKMSGNWKASVTVFDPSGQSMQSDATAMFEMILGGRYMKSSFKGTMMGMPFEGMGLDAYDNATKEYISTWVDNMGTGLMYMKGKWDDATKSIIYTGTMVDPMSGKDQLSKSISKQIDENHVVMTMFNIVDGKDVKSMEIAYSR
jgi:Protein of unknown function (DUF1579)